MSTKMLLMEHLEAEEEARYEKEGLPWIFGWDGQVPTFLCKITMVRSYEC